MKFTGVLGGVPLGEGVEEDEGRSPLEFIPYLIRDGDDKSVAGATFG